MLLRNATKESAGDRNMVVHLAPYRSRLPNALSPLESEMYI